MKDVHSLKVKKSMSAVSNNKINRFTKIFANGFNDNFLRNLSIKIRQNMSISIPIPAPKSLAIGCPSNKVIPALRTIGKLFNPIGTKRPIKFPIQFPAERSCPSAAKIPILYAPPVATKKPYMIVSIQNQTPNRSQKRLLFTTVSIP